MNRRALQSVERRKLAAGSAPTVAQTAAIVEGARNIASMTKKRSGSKRAVRE
jgi:hypothetical protein